MFLAGPKLHITTGRAPHSRTAALAIPPGTGKRFLTAHRDDPASGGPVARSRGC
jgi:hypothetical protein